jgi:hypothetical protein
MYKSILLSVSIESEGDKTTPMSISHDHDSCLSTFFVTVRVWKSICAYGAVQHAKMYDIGFILFVISF